MIFDKKEINHGINIFSFLLKDVFELFKIEQSGNLRARDKESQKVKILQELTHDLRTPITSLKNLIETLDYQFEVLSKEEKKELISLSLKEINYFEKVIEDLLMLGRVSEFDYKKKVDSIKLTDLINSEIERLSFITEVEISLSINKEESINYICNEYLIRRLFRNILENACDYSRGKVFVEINIFDHRYDVKIQDNGNGFPDDILKNYGEKRMSRINDFKRMDHRISLGLGSVIAKAIVQFHDGQILVSNNEIGALVNITLPKV